MYSLEEANGDMSSGDEYKPDEKEEAEAASSLSEFDESMSDEDLSDITAIKTSAKKVLYPANKSTQYKHTIQAQNMQRSSLYNSLTTTIVRPLLMT